MGQAYGSLIDNAYVVDFEEGIEFLPTAAILVNRDRIFNDEHYEHERGRERPRRPDLSDLRLYDWSDAQGRAGAGRSEPAASPKPDRRVASLPPEGPFF